MFLKMKFQKDSAANWGYISGMAKVDAVGVRRSIRLFNRADFSLVRHTRSNPETGSYSFRNLDETLTYYVIGFDYPDGEEYNAVIKDKITPAVESWVSQ